MADQFRGDNFTRWLLTISAALIASAVAALWQMTTHLAALDERMAQWTRVYDNRFEEAAKRDNIQAEAILKLQDRLLDDEKHIFRNDSRIDSLERERK